MRATGIVRRIDDLGRIVIPREIRHTMKIKDGDPLEIFIHDGAVCFKPYLIADLPTLQERVQTDEHFCNWLRYHWGAVHRDIVNGEGKFPYVYDELDGYYNEFLSKGGNE